MKELLSKWSYKKLLIIIPLVLSILTVFLLVSFKKGPEKLAVTEVSKPVRIINVKNVNLVPRAIGYGKAAPADVWKAVAQVSGKIVKTSEILRQGNMCKAGTFLLKIDPREYELAVVRMEASIAEVKARISQLKTEEKNQKLNLSIEEKSLKLSKVEWERQKKLYRKDVISASNFESETQKYNSQLLKVQSIKNSIKLFPSNKRQLSATLSLNQANLEQAKRDLANTVIKAPYNSRITEVSIQKEQFVQKGQVIITADGTSSTEISAQIPVDKFFNIVSSITKGKKISPFDLDKFKEILGTSVLVKFNTSRSEVIWKGRFSRSDASLDQETRTVGVIVAVDDPYEKIIPGKRPPLVRNMYCEVELAGKPLVDTIVIPRSSLHEGFVYLVDNESRLIRRKVIKNFSQSGFYVVKSGLKVGDRLVISDLIPAIDGMLLSPEVDNETEKRLYDEATGLTKIK